MKADREIWLVAVQRYAGNFSPLCETDYYGRNEVIPWEFCFDLEIVSEALKGRPAESSPWSNENTLHLLLGKETLVGNVPAVSRYISKRIDWVAKQAENKNLNG